MDSPLSLNKSFLVLDSYYEKPAQENYSVNEKIFMELKWFVLYTKPRFERKILEALSRKKISSYFPVKRNIRSVGVTYKLLEEPLFPSYIFVKTFPKDFTDLKKIPGVISFVYWLGNPVSMSDTEVRSLRQFLVEHVSIVVQKTNLGNDIANLIDGSESIIQDNHKSGQTKIGKILLPSLGYQLAGEAVSNANSISKNLSKHPKLAGFKLLNSMVNFNNFI